MVSIKTFARLTPDNSEIEFYENNCSIGKITIKDIKESGVKHIGSFIVFYYNNNKIIISYSDFPTTKIINTNQPLVHFDHITYGEWKKGIVISFLVIMCFFVLNIITITTIDRIDSNSFLLIFGTYILTVIIISFINYQKIKIK